MRSAGILLPISSLPSPYGIGCFGKEAYEFVDFLAKAGQRYWQILPIGPTSFGDSPYQSFSSFAGNPYFIDLEDLTQQSLLTREECGARDFGDTPDQVDYEKLYENRFDLLRVAYDRFDKEADDFHSFCVDNGWWLEDYTLYMGLKVLHDMEPFYSWPNSFRLREREALEDFAAEYKGEVDFWKFLQFIFYRQWQALKSYANGRGVFIIGDIPIYVAPDSADVWANSRLFLLDEDQRPMEVAGCPPDGFSEDGQLWGNPLYDWEYHKKTGYDWWLRRLGFAGQIYNVIRIDHFRGFESFYAIPAEDKTAAGGIWRGGPGMDFIGRVKEEFPRLQIIAEDLGHLTLEVIGLLRDSGFPGMKVLQFAFGGGQSSEYLPHFHRRHAVVYTGTHDNTTTADWEQSAPPKEVAFAREYLGVSPGGELTEYFIRAALASVCDLAVIPIQDYLGLGAEARVNTPSTLGGNWCWRLTPDALDEDCAARIGRLTGIYGR